MLGPGPVEVEVRAVRASLAAMAQISAATATCPCSGITRPRSANYDQAIRVPESLYRRLRQRQARTLDRFGARHGRPPTDAERRALARFPTRSRNLAGPRSLSYSWFNIGFKQWIAELNFGTCVPHRARHTLVTTLLRHGASLTHIRRYLGQVSDRMAERYTHVAVSEIEDVLQHERVAGSAAPHPGELLSGGTKAMSREQAQVRVSGRLAADIRLEQEVRDLLGDVSRRRARRWSQRACRPRILPGRPWSIFVADALLGMRCSQAAATTRPGRGPRHDGGAAGHQGFDSESGSARSEQLGRHATERGSRGGPPNPTCAGSLSWMRRRLASNAAFPH